MGGRGAISGITPRGKKYPFNYGEEYRTVLQVGRIKFVKMVDNRKSSKNNVSTKPPQETKGKRRIYVTVSAQNQLKNISFYRKGKLFAQIDLDHTHKNLGIKHIHIGKEHATAMARNPNKRELIVIDKIIKIWQNERRNSVKGARS